MKDVLNDAIAAATKAIKDRSYAGRHPEQGKMVNCPICGLRHREVVHHVLKYVAEVPRTRKGIQGAAAFAKKRYHPHPNKKNLQLVQRTQELFPMFYTKDMDPAKAMKLARTEAHRQLKEERAAERRFKRHQQQIARKINFGLLQPGSRP